jgi:hypothetical protein
VSGATTAARSATPPTGRASALVGAGLTASCGNGPIRALKDGRKHGQELLRRKLLFLVQWRVAENTHGAFRASPRLPPAATGRLALVQSETWPGAPQLPFHQSDRSGQVLCDGPDVPERVHRADNGEHDGALRRFEYHRYLTFAGAYSDLKGASWEWLTYSHLADLSRSVGTTATTSAPPWLCSRRGRI